MFCAEDKVASQTGLRFRPRPRPRVALQSVDYANRWMQMKTTRRRHC